MKMRASGGDGKPSGSASPPPPRDPNAQEQADANEATDENRRDRCVQIGHGDRRGDRESTDAANQGSPAILLREPPQLGRQRDCGADADQATADRAKKQSSLSERVPENRSNHCAETREAPRCDKER